ncbi:MAG: aminoacyl-tRNA hydrolase [Candidatus Eisenbacteria bacterium]|nr:aminoacyl-tRNA hydrolase [Candidatus Eisenbacteria bacterium]
MDLIVGLGNPGREYEGTRHNVGFRVVSRLASRSGIALRAGRGEFLSGSGRVAGRAIELALPLTYMNMSGLAVRELLSLRGLAASGLLVICDDVNLPLGRIRLRPAGSDGGHNGLSSIIAQLGTEAFPRLRLGVGGAPEDEDLAEYVLGMFEAREEPAVEEMIERAVGAVDLCLARGIDAAMQECNRRPEPASGDDEPVSGTD